MAEETPELPVVEEPKTEEAPAIDVDGLVAELEKAGIANPQELQGKLDAGVQAGRMAQLLGDERELTKQLQGKVNELSSKPPVREDFEFPQEGQSIDIEAMMDKSVNKALDTRDKKQLVAHQAAMRTWNEIQTDESYGLVKEVWEEKTKDPNFAYKVQGGLIDPMKEYAATVRGYYQGLLKQSHETIKQLQGSGPITPPHVEASDQTGNIVSEGDAPGHDRKFLDDIKEKVRKGHTLSDVEEAILVETMQIPLETSPPFDLGINK